MGRPRTIAGEKKKRGGGEPYGNAAMSFSEIGEAEGITYGGAFMAYQSAMRKLRRRPHQLAVLVELAAELNRGRREDQSIYNGGHSDAP
jgi:hypothetical protein